MEKSYRKHSGLPMLLLELIILHYDVVFGIFSICVGTAEAPGSEAEKETEKENEA